MGQIPCLVEEREVTMPTASTRLARHEAHIKLRLLAASIGDEVTQVNCNDISYG